LFAASASSQNVDLNCTFVLNYNSEYACRLFNIEVTNPSQNVNFVGQHLEGRSNANVQAVEIRGSNTPFTIPQIFTTFPNIVELFIHNSNLQSISIPDTVQLQRIDFNRNNISRILNGTFSGQRQLTFLQIANSQVEVVEQDAFIGLANVTYLNLAFNRIELILPPTMVPLTNLATCDLEGNLLTRMNCGVFGRSANLRSLYLENNRINAICTNFTRRLSSTVTFLNLSGNRCVDRRFQLGDELGLITLNNALNSCFNIYRDIPTTERRQITLEFEGPLVLFDQFGNIIARVN
jgi:Leucine rich repeat